MHDLYSLNFEELLDYIKGIGGAIVVWRPVGGIGDAVMILPAITALRTEWGDAVPIIVLCIDYIEPIFRHHPGVSVVIGLAPDAINKREDLRIATRLREAGSIIYPLYYPCPAAVYEASHNPLIAKSRQEIFAENCDVKFNGSGYGLVVDDADFDLASELELEDRYIVVQLRSHDTARDYPKLLTKAVLCKFSRWRKKYDIQIVTIDSVMGFGVKGVRELYQQHLNTVMAVISNALAVVGPDSSMVHIGGALGTRILGIFGPTDPAVRLKYDKAAWMGGFERCGRQYCWYCPCKQKFCLKTLLPIKIVKTVEEILREENVI